MENYELLWVRVQGSTTDVFIGALYHPPKPVYSTSALLDHLECCLDALSDNYPNDIVMLAGDFNALDNDDVVSRCALTPIVHQPTRGLNILDRIYVNQLVYAEVKVVASAVRSDHKAVIAYNGPMRQALNKEKRLVTFRRRTPTQHAMFLQYLTDNTPDFTVSEDVQTGFNRLYDTMTCLLDTFYPIRRITVTSSDPPFVSPAVKAMLRRKNRLNEDRAC